jgi:hypothetical protein
MRLRQLSSSAFTLLILFFGSLCLSACDKAAFPVYWLCEGSSEQVVFNSSKIPLEKYQGKGPLMLEIWGSQIYQFLQGSFSGAYAICDQEKNISHIDFRLNGCEQVADLDRRGMLNLNTGELLMREIRSQGDRVIRNEGRYQCRMTGRTFNFADFNHE